MNIEFKAFVTEEIENNVFTQSIKSKNTDELPKGDVLIKVEYSSLNYKDALSANGHKGITRNYPHTPGIDAAGEVAFSQSDKFKIGDKVLVTGYDLGMNTAGGFGQYIRVPEDWIVRIPANMNTYDAMAYGTAGFTAAVAIWEIISHEITPNSGRVLVSGATGGVGSLAIAILSKIGFEVIASTRKESEIEYLKSLGAKEVIPHETVKDESNKPLLSKRWIAAIDNVGGVTLSSIMKATDHRGVVCCIGNVESSELNTNIFPFILRGIKLIGIDSASRPMKLREMLWSKLANEWKPSNLDTIIRTVGLSELKTEIDRISNGLQKGRVVVDLWK